MSPLNVPKLLLEIVESYLESELISLISCLENDTQRSQIFKLFVQEWFPSNFKSSFINRILRRYDISSNIKYSTLVLFYGPDVRSINFSFLSENFYSKVAKFFKEDLCDTAEVLNLRGVWLKDKEREIFIESLRSKRNIRKLSIPYIASNHMLDVLSRNSSQLIYLDIGGSSELSLAGLTRLHTVKLISGCRNSDLCHTLQYLNLGGVGKLQLPPENVADILFKLKNLISIGSYPYTGEAAALSKKKSGDPEFKLKLRYMHDSDTDCGRFISLIKILPDLIGCFLYNPEDAVLKYLHSFKALKKLKVSKTKASLLQESLEKLGSQGLMELECINLRENLDLSIVAQTCPDLTVLEIFYSRGVMVSSFENFKFNRMKKISIYCTEIPSYSCRPILLSVPHVEKLTLSQCDSLTDDSFFEILGDNSFQDLVELTILQAPFLTVQTIRCIMTCLDKLTFLGKLDTWNVLWTQVEEVRSEIKEYNLKLKLWESFSANDINGELGEMNLRNNVFPEGAEYLPHFD
ncbi:uncharacterized protein [Lepeophtheirus salmonis]|uniref:uncharacterized protein n=1 Tax=Lepeophtheirus salmonis TaxID=72036 RepID=UPI001AEA6B65|nr:uncharacterized protein LOC121118707 [Lepeophtheirus salmonis]